MYLDAFPILRAPLVNMLTSFVASNEADSLDVLMIAYSINSWYRSVHHVQDTRRKTGTLGEFGNYHSCAGVAFGGF
jgi:hypothetical protein